MVKIEHNYHRDSLLSIPLIIRNEKILNKLCFKEKGHIWTINKEAIKNRQNRSQIRKILNIKYN